MDMKKRLSLLLALALALGLCATALAQAYEDDDTAIAGYYTDPDTGNSYGYTTIKDDSYTWPESERRNDANRIFRPVESEPKPETSYTFPYGYEYIVWRLSGGELVLYPKGTAFEVTDVAKRATIYERPSGDSEVLGYARLGDTVKLWRASSSLEWYLVIYNDGENAGWIRAKYLTPQ